MGAIMKKATFHEIQGVLVSQGRTDLAKALAGITPGVPDGTGPRGGTKDCQMQEEGVVKSNDYEEYLKSTLNNMGKTLKDIKDLSSEEWQMIDNGYKAKEETD